MLKKLVFLFAVFIIVSGFISAKTILPFKDLNAKNWSKGDVVYICVDKAELENYKKAAEKLWVVISARYLGPNGFWKIYPEFTEKCVINKTYDFKWIEAIEVPLKSVKSNWFKVDNAKGVYYGFVIVKKEGKLFVVSPEKIGGKKILDSKDPKSAITKVKNPVKLTRKWDDDKKKFCK